jgi:hypothetical protein
MIRLPGSGAVRLADFPPAQRADDPPPGSGAVRLDDLLNPPPPPLRQAFENRVELIMRVRGLPRPEAERLAFEAVLIDWLNATHPNTPSDRCAWCGKPEAPGAALLPIGWGAHHAWLHNDDCWALWRERRRAEAIVELAAMGITS